MRKIILYTLGVIILVVAVVVSYLLVTAEEQKKPATRKEVKTVFIDTVVNSTIPIIIPANGNLAAKERVEVYAEVQGNFQI